MEKYDDHQSLIRRLILRFVLWTMGLLLVIYAGPVLLRFLFPFILALLVAGLINPLINWIERWTSKIKIKSSYSRKVATFTITVLILAVILFGIYLLVSSLISEITQLTSRILYNWPGIVAFFEDSADWFSRQIDILPAGVTQFFDAVTVNVLNFIRNFSENLLNQTVSFTGGLISQAGTVTLNAITFFLALYFMTTEFDRLQNLTRSKLPKNILHTLGLLKDTVVLGVGGYIKSQVMLAFIAFILIFAALGLYGYEYALTAAFILAVLDAIPLIGANGILIPWGIFEFFFDDVRLGTFLMILGVALFFVRRIIEPNIMARQIGLHPLLALIGIYIGIHVSGLWGAILGPLVMVILVGILTSGVLDSTWADLKDFYHWLSLKMRRD